MYTYLGVQSARLIPQPKEIITVDENHRIKVYQHAGLNTLLYVPQHRNPNRAVPWRYYTERISRNGSYDSWASYDMQETLDKMGLGG